MFERTLSLWFLAVTFIGGISSGSDRNLLARLPIPRAAYEVQEFSVGSQRPNQLSFKVDLSYPSKEILELYEKYFASEGWTKCAGGMDDWDSFVDESLERNPLIHQLLQYWVKRDQNLEALVALRYYSEGVDETQATPTNARQHVTVLIIDDIPDLDRQLRLYGLECPPE